MPIFHKGVLVGFSCCMAHWLDIGGTLGGMTTDIYSEGLQIPILKLHDRGKVNDTLIEVIKQNMRLPSRAMGDLRAQITAVKTGERRFLELVERYGRDAVLGAIKAIMDHSEAMARARTRSIPDGVYEAESYMDDDGIDIGKKVPIKVRVIVKGDEMTVDLTDVSRQVRGFYNSGITTGFACSQVAYKCLTSPTDYPINDGSFRSLKAIVPPGRIISAVRPAPMRWWMTYPMTIVDTVFKALAPVIPDRAIAGHHADLLIAALHGINTKTSEFFLANFGPLGGGWGAKRSEDGVSATVCINDGDTHNSPSEQSEVKFPIVVERYALVPDSGGAGRHRGGLGRRARGARAGADDVQHPGRARPLQAVGAGRRRRRHRQRSGAAARRQVEDRFPQRQGAGGDAQDRRRVPAALRRRRRLWLAAAKAGCRCRRRCQAGLHLASLRCGSFTASCSIPTLSPSTARRPNVCATRCAKPLPAKFRAAQEQELSTTIVCWARRHAA